MGNMRNLSVKGLSMSQAQSISNLCNQRAQNITDQLEIINNASKTITIDGTDYTQQEAVSMPINVIEMILEKGRLHATQAFLMEATRSKSSELDRLNSLRYNYDVAAPERKYASLPILTDSVDEDWGWLQLTDAEMAEYLSEEAYASHIGQFIHKRGKLSKLREELVGLPSLEWMTVKDGEKTPVKVLNHHKSTDLNALHEKLAALHRNYEQRVNYFKAKVKNLVTLENASIHTGNAKLITEHKAEQDEFDSQYSIAYGGWNTKRSAESAKFEAERENLIKEVAGLRINVSPKFQEVIDMFITASED